MSKLQQTLHKILSLEEAKTFAQTCKKSGSTVVFTNGCFDILHKGHVTYLARAADLGDKLIVAVNTDSSVKSLGKSPDRPINPQDARLLVLASLQFVDAVILFDGYTPLKEIITLQPNILVKGADYDPNETDEFSKKYIVGSKEVRALGGKVEVIDLVEGYSTTNILAKSK
jgi:D-glycero-beta-D-manno-heptose 1-phosphate adenylyltransferase